MDNAARVSRREVLKAVSAAGLAMAMPAGSFAQADWRQRVAQYLSTLARPSGGYGWEDFDRPHLTPTCAAVGCWHLLGQTPPDRQALAAFIRASHPTQLKKLEQEHRQFEWEQIQALIWLGEDASAFTDQVRAWRTPAVYLKQYERSGCPILRHEAAAFVCRELLGLPMDDLSPQYIDYLNTRRRPDGSFNNTPATDGGGGHVMNTWWGLQALRALGRSGEERKATVQWLRACQLPSGGFTWQPDAPLAAVDDVAYTWAAVRALKLLGAAPADAAACRRYLHSLWNTDGGFGDRPGWASNAVATYYALDALDALGELNAAPPAPRPARAADALPEGLRVWSIQLESHGQGSPAEAVDLARALHIHLWGANVVGQPTLHFWPATLHAGEARTISRTHLGRPFETRSNVARRPFDQPPSPDARYPSMASGLPVSSSAEPPPHPSHPADITLSPHSPVPGH